MLVFNNKIIQIIKFKNKKLRLCHYTTILMYEPAETIENIKTKGTKAKLATRPIKIFLDKRFHE